MRIITLNDENKKNLLENLLKRSPNSYGQYEQIVSDIIAQVKAEKDDALFALTSKFDQCVITKETIRVTADEIKEAYEMIDPALVEVMKKSAANIIKFHEKQLRNSWISTEENGTILGQKWQAYRVLL